MKFNLKKYAKQNAKEGDIHGEKKLQREHSQAPETVTEKQLDRDRVPEKEVIVEKLLDYKRTGGADTIIEKKLNDAKSALYKHRNTNAFSGNINKVEELRLSKATQESEKYENASSTPKKKRWWDNLKAEASKQRVVTAQEMDFDAQEMDFEGEGSWGRMNETWSDDKGVRVDRDIDLDKGLPNENTFIEELGAHPVIVDEIRPVDTPIVSGLYITLDITDEGGQLSLSELQQAAYDAVIAEGYGYLIDVDGFTPQVFVNKGGQLVARLIGDEFHPSTWASKSVDADSIGGNPFSVASLERTEVEGVVLGTVTIDPEMRDMVRDMEDDELRMKVRDVISEAHPEVNVEDDGIDLDKIGSGEISFVGQVSLAKKGRPESWEQVKGEPIASTDFDIIVLSDTKKKQIPIK